MPPEIGAESPWMDDRPRIRVAESGKSPVELRPDLPWLAELEMPDLPVRWDARVIEFLDFYKNDPRGRNIMGAWLRDQGKYRDLILTHLRRAKLPEDLLYVCMIESSYDPFEYSWAGASGLWQFMPHGGRVYGLGIDRWVDERNDPLRSTEAVLLYWTDLYQRFGDWDLAMAAYNAGYAGVLRSIAKYNTNDFWQLLDYENALPWGSSIYVPKALAAAIVGHNRKLFGYDDVVAAAPVQWETVTVPKSVALATVARAAGVKTKVIADLNPHLRRKRTPPGVKDFSVRVPVGHAQRFAERFPRLRAEWDRDDVYVVSHGERFEDIATIHGISRTKLRELNGIEHESEVEGGSSLVVPRVSEATRRGNFERAMDKLYAGGHPAGRKGDQLIVAVPDKKLRVDGHKRVFYRVVSGDSQFGIARAFGVDRRQLAGWNGLDPEGYVHPRMVLQVFVPVDTDLATGKVKVLDPKRLMVVDRGSVEHIAAAEGRLGRRRVTYKAKRRESFATIAKKFGLSDHDLARINRRPRKTVLDKGEEVIVYEVVDAGRSKRAAQQARKARKNAGKKKAGKKTKKKVVDKKKKVAGKKTADVDEAATKTKTKTKTGTGTER